MSPDRLDLAPTREPGAGRAMGLSLLAHLLLAGALAWGVRWTQSNPQVAFSAELWSPTAQEAAPAAAEPPPPPPPPPAEAARPAPPPPAAREPEQPKADIALEREKKRRLEEERKKAEAKEKAQKEKAEKEKAEKAEKEKLAKDKARKEEEARRQKEKEREQAKAKEEARKEQARKEAAAEAAQEKMRQEQLRRIQGLAGATGSPDARGTALRASAPSASYAGKIVEAIKNNTTFTDASAGRPSVVVLVKTSPSGLILSRKVVTPSGNKAWDDAVLRAVDKMGNVPKDADGRIPEVLLQEGLEIKVTL